MPPPERAAASDPDFAEHLTQTAELKRSRYKAARRRNAAIKLVAAHPDRFPPGHPVRVRLEESS